MARHKTTAAGGRRGAVLALGACLLAAALFPACSRDGRSSFHFSGSITAPPHIQKLIERPNLVLYVVAADNSGVPIAVHKIINPRLPVYYRVTAEDLVLPGPAWNGPLRVEVFVNAHGQLGTAQPGDLRGTHQGGIRSGERNANVIIDRKID